MNKRIEVTKTPEGFVLTPIGQNMDRFSNQEIKAAIKKALLKDIKLNKGIARDVNITVVRKEKDGRPTIKKKKKRSHNSEASLN